MDLKLGVIIRPIESSPFRLGFAVHTPTWYDLRESSNAALSSNILACEDVYKRQLYTRSASIYFLHSGRISTGSYSH